MVNYAMFVYYHSYTLYQFVNSEHYCFPYCKCFPLPRCIACPHTMCSYRPNAFFYFVKYDQNVFQIQNTHVYVKYVFEIHVFEILHSTGKVQYLQCRRRHTLMI